MQPRDSKIGDSLPTVVIGVAWVCQDCGGTITTMRYRVPRYGRQHTPRPHAYDLKKHTRDTGCLCRQVEAERMAS